MGVEWLEISDRGPLAGGEPFGSTGPFERIQGTLHFAVDPRRPDHQVVTDLERAPRDQDGLVRFSSDLLLLKPATPSPDGSLVCDVVNRGSRTVLRMFDGADADRTGPELDIGDGFLLRQGFTVAFLGWQHDVPAGMAIRVPEAREEGAPLRGQAYIQYQLTRREHAVLLSDAGHRPLPAADPNDPGAVLTVREHPDGDATVVDRSRWRFARVVDDQVVPDPNYLYLGTGFEPGKVYEIIYTAVGAPVIGLGFLALRDCVSFLKYGTVEDGNPCAGTIRYGVGYGASQCGRFLREFLYHGLNVDERGRLVFDGVFAHTGSSRRGEFNVRFGQPSTNILRSPSALFPMSYQVQTDPVTGLTDGLLARLATRGAVPKVIATNTGVEYWWSGASLAHTDVEGKRDVDPPPSVRVYYLAGTHHQPGTLPPSDVTPEGVRVQHLLNTVDFRPIMRAILVRLDRWVRGIDDPPPGRYPRIADGAAVRREELAQRFRSIPGVHFPAALPVRRRLDFGLEAEHGVLHYPPRDGPPFGTVVSALDADGNEVAGVRPVDVRVPLGTYTGWTVRHPDIGGAGHFVPLLGATHPFARSATEGLAAADPRPSIDERYSSREDYLARARSAAHELMTEGFLLEEDVERVVAQAGARYDAFRHGRG